MKVLLINQAEVHELLTIVECIDVMERTLEALARGKALNPLRQVLRLPEKPGVLGLMPGFLAEGNLAGLKVVSVFPQNQGTEFDSHQGAVLLFETERGCLQAIIDATAITGLRTAAVSGVATKLLAREDASLLAILGSGVQAQAHLAAMLAVRPIQQVRAWSPDRTRLQSFAETMSAKHNVVVTPARGAQEAVTGADIICTTTSAREPVLFGNWVSPGAHINAVGACLPSARELDTAAVAQARLYVDCREATLHEAGDFRFPKQEGVVDDDHIQGEIGELLTGQIRGRRDSKEVTLFKSLGLAVEDLAAGHYVYQKALRNERGTWVSFGGQR